MPNEFKIEFLKQLEKRFGKPKRLPNSKSLLEIGDGLARIYVRYSTVLKGKRTFYGLRKEDLRQLEGFNSILCFLWSDQAEPVFIPFAAFEDVFNSLTPASDGQFKAQIYQDDGTELYIANAGRFSVEGYVGWQSLDTLIDAGRLVDSSRFQPCSNTDPSRFYWGGERIRYLDTPKRSNQTGLESCSSICVQE